MKSAVIIPTSLVHASVSTNLEGLQVSSRQLFDDNLLDCFVRSTTEERPGRPREAYWLDEFSAHQSRNNPCERMPSYPVPVSGFTVV